MDKREVYNDLVSLADHQLSEIKRSIPPEPELSVAFLIETTRISDYLHLGFSNPMKEFGLSLPDLDILKMGWNLATSLLFKSVSHIPGLPAMESTVEMQKYAIGILYQLGCTSLLKRTAEMVNAEILIPCKTEKGMKFSMSTKGTTQFLDELELMSLNELEEKINSITEGRYNEWNLVDNDNIESIQWQVGNYLSFGSKNDNLSEYKIQDLDSEMIPLVRPWDSGKGIMIAYDTTPELDKHFMVQASELVYDWREEAGFHPNAEINGLKGSDIMAVTIVLVSIYLKHIHFTSLASNKYSEVNVKQSLTIWNPLEEFVSDISEFTGMSEDVVRRVFKEISLKESDVTLLEKHTSRFMPLIIDLENGFVLRPVSSISRNPLNTIKDLLILRNPNLRNVFLEGREEWLRNKLYAQFFGSRYQCVEGNIDLRTNNKTATDIDAAIYDNTTGELALFQIKWQDYHFNDVKKLRSRAKNLTSELDKWTRKVNEWINHNGHDQLLKNLRLKGIRKLDPSRVYLFGLSKNAARMEGYGYTLSENKIAIGTWAQFVNSRTEIGPSKNVFGDLYNRLKEQEKTTVSVFPLPATFKVANKEYYYEDLWNTDEQVIRGDK